MPRPWCRFVPSHLGRSSSIPARSGSRKTVYAAVLPRPGRWNAPPAQEARQVLRFPSPDRGPAGEGQRPRPVEQAAGACPSRGPAEPAAAAAEAGRASGVEGGVAPRSRAFRRRLTFGVVRRRAQSERRAFPRGCKPSRGGGPTQPLPPGADCRRLGTVIEATRSMHRRLSARKDADFA
jgi:hypothetical protein